MGDDRLTAMQACVDARRAQRKPDDGFLSRAARYFKKSLEQQIRSQVSMQTLKERGYIPLDFVQRKIPWDLVRVYPASAIRDFGIDFECALELGFESNHFKYWDIADFRAMGVGVDKMLQTNLTMPDVLSLKLSPTDLYELGWRYSTFKKVGATEQNLKQLCSEKDMRIYFQKPAAKKKTFNGSIKF